MTREPFDLARSPLSGVNLIEASAGTGKTYTIAGLYLRLVLEQRMTVESILVVTFTEAATQELKERILKRLKDARAAFEKGESDEPLLSALIVNTQDIDADKDILDMAIRSFDQAAVFTIHGFCQRMLVENAFESGALFDTELVTDTDVLFREVITDYYRLNVYNQPDLFLGYLRNQGITPDTFLVFVKRVWKPGIRVIPKRLWMDTGSLELPFLDGYRHLAAEWASGREDVVRMLINDTGLNRNKYRAASISKWAAHMDGFLLTGADPFASPECLEKFTASALEGSVKKGHPPPMHPFFDTAGSFQETERTLSEAFENNLYCLKTGALEYADHQMNQRKEDLGIMGFDDLLIRLYQGVTGPMGDRLSSQIRQTFSAALIDEFQDTDPVQYGIFSRVFAREETPLFMIGDPKQAIYSFRGADIFAYMQAVSESESRYSLGFNYRSEGGLIRAVNTLFTFADNPFVFDAIDFEPAAPAEGLEKEFLTEKGKEYAPFQLWLLEAPDKPLPKGDVRAFVSHAVAREIGRLLDLGREGDALLGGRPVCERDMAVLVRTNSEAQAMKKVLNDAGIPAVIYDTGNVFHSEEAEELQRIIHALARPTDDGLIKAALTTHCLGLSAEDIAAFEIQPHSFDNWSDRFREYHRLWQRYGFIEAINDLIKDQDVRARLMGCAQGERKNTNLSHLIQLLHQASLEGKGSPERLPVWLGDRISDDMDTEEHQLRLESDDEAVRIVTVHKSKGMEYPLVFCPSVWDTRKPKDRGFCVFHDPDTHKTTCDLGSESYQNNRLVANQEALAEDLRLLYVALTRARNRCYGVWGRVKDTGGSAMAYLLCGGTLPEDDQTLGRIARDLESRSGGSIACSRIETGDMAQRLPAKENDNGLSVRPFHGHIETRYRITSFSALSARKIHPADEADRDAIVEQAVYRTTREGSQEKTIFTFPKGAAAGTFLHDIFEHADFMADRPELESLVDSKLVDYGYDEAWKDCLADMLLNVLNAPLSLSDRGFSLAAISNDRRLNELEFYYPLNAMEPADLESVFRRHGVRGGGQAPEGSAHRLNFSPVQGFLKGFVDLIFSRESEGVERFYIVDWKSNFLGDRPDDYRPDVLGQVMAEEHYVLQYHLYVLALHRYLSLKLGDTYRYSEQFGGVFYVFLRGVSPSGPENGIFYDRPEEALISGLSDLFWGRG